MNLGAQTGRMVELEPIDGVPAAVEAPVGPTVADPVTGEISEYGPEDVETVLADA